MDHEKEATKLAHKLGFVSYSMNWWEILRALQKAAQQAGVVDAATRVDDESIVNQEGAV